MSPKFTGPREIAELKAKLAKLRRLQEILARARCNNIQRYRQLLNIKLTDLERQYIEKRLSEEQSTLETLAASTLPVSFKTSRQQAPFATKRG